MKLTGFNIFKAGVYITRGNWANAADFCDYFKKDFTKISFDKDAVIEKINQLAKPCKSKTEIEQAEALKIVLGEDLINIRENIIKNKFNDPETEICENFNILKGFLMELGIKYDRPLFVVDRFPKPYDFFDKTGVTGTNFDDADHDMFGLEQGIYLKRENLNTLTCNFIMAHELIHNVCGLNDCNYLARGLEEGFTQLFGEIYLCSKIIGTEAAINYMVNKRLAYPADDQQWEMYTDWLRQGCVFYQKLGLKGIIEIMKKGRGTIKNADELMMQGQLDEPKLPAGNWIKELDKAAQMILSFNRNLVYSPLAVYLAKNLKNNDDVNDLLLRLNVKKTAGIKTLKELNERVFSILVSENKIAIDDTKLYLISNNLRYELRKFKK